MGWRHSGGISALCRLIQSHQAEVVADLRSHYGVGLWDVSLRELRPLVLVLLRDPTSWLFAEVNGWEFPTSREALTVADLFDVFVQANSRRGSKPKPYPRPFSAAKKYGGRGSSRTVAELEALFASVRGDDD